MRLGRLVRQVLVIGWAFSLVFVSTDALPGCPTCKEGLHANQAGLAFAVSVLLMMSMPFLLLACWAVAIVGLRSRPRGVGMGQPLPYVSSNRECRQSASS